MPVWGDWRGGNDAATVVVLLVMLPLAAAAKPVPVAALGWMRGSGPALVLPPLLLRPSLAPADMDERWATVAEASLSREAEGSRASRAGTCFGCV